MVYQYFKDLYTRDSRLTNNVDWLAAFPSMSQVELDWIQRMVDFIEVKNTAFSIGAFKVPGQDGLQAHFFQTQWNFIGHKIFALVQEFFSKPKVVKEVNQTNIVLIPKVEHPTFLKEFRPISLCNMSFKIITKLLANQLKVVMNGLVAQEQCSFISSRTSCDNIIIAQEVIHSMRLSKQKKGFVAIKVDMEKAYDCLDWSFIQDTLVQIGLGQLLNLIMACITTASIRVL